LKRKFLVARRAACKDDSLRPPVFEIRSSTSGINSLVVRLTERAAAALAEARRLSPGDPYSSIARLKTEPWVSNSAPKVRALYETTFFSGLRKIGVPEE
jgi:hypothetical protein